MFEGQLSCLLLIELSVIGFCFVCWFGLCSFYEYFTAIWFITIRKPVLKLLVSHGCIGGCTVHNFGGLWSWVKEHVNSDDSWGLAEEPQWDHLLDQYVCEFFLLVGPLFREEDMCMVLAFCIVLVVGSGKWAWLLGLLEIQRHGVKNTFNSN